MPDPMTVTPKQIAAALDRAARYRRSLVPAEWQGKPNLTELVTTQLMHPARGIDDGWWHIGNVLDSFSEWQPILAVWWNPATDAVKVQRPPNPVVVDPPNPTYTEHDFNRSGRNVLGYEPAPEGDVT